MWKRNSHETENGKSGMAAYMVDVLPLFAGSKIDHWIHGHVHVQMQSLSRQPQIHSNPMGYVDDGENRDFRRDAVIELQ